MLANKVFRQREETDTNDWKIVGWWTVHPHGHHRETGYGEGLPGQVVAAVFWLHVLPGRVSRGAEQDDRGRQQSGCVCSLWISRVCLRSFLSGDDNVPWQCAIIEPHYFLHRLLIAVFADGVGQRKDMAGELVPIFISVDPRRDSLEKIAAYLKGAPCILSVHEFMLPGYIEEREERSSK